MNRQIVHYGQPHQPFLCETSGEDVGTLWTEIMNGEIDIDIIWEYYLDNLRLVLDEISILIENVNAPKTVITADHGEAFGELGFYKHPAGTPHPAVRKVPWVETTAQDQGNYEIELTNPKHEPVSNEEMEQRLESLGYKL
jgi:hypothetical protein